MTRSARLVVLVVLGALAAAATAAAAAASGAPRHAAEGVRVPSDARTVLRDAAEALGPRSPNRSPNPNPNPNRNHAPSAARAASEAVQRMSRAELERLAVAALLGNAPGEPGGAADDDDACAALGATPVSDDERAEWEALRRLYEATDGAAWRDQACWDRLVAAPARACPAGAAPGPGLAGGVECRGGRVVALDLQRLGLRAASVPSNLEGLAALERLDLSENALAGVLPHDWRGAGSLKELRLTGNAISGTMPARWSGVPRLETLSLSLNRLSGPLPGAYTGLGALVYLSLSYNGLTGAPPVAYSGVDRLQFLYARSNRLEGRVPAAFTGLPSVVEVAFPDNRLSGELPGTFSGLETLQMLDLANNRLSGRLPGRAGGLPSVTAVFLTSNRVGGTLSPLLFASMPRLELFDAANNQISGTLPGKFDCGGAENGTTQLRGLALGYNSLTGTLPPSVSGMAHLEDLDLSYNGLSGALPPAEVVPGLARLNMAGNRLGGGLPGGWTFPANSTLSLSGNPLGGPVPPSLLRTLTYFVCEACSLAGTLDTLDAGDVARLVEFSVSGNAISGPLPRALVEAPLLRVLSLEHNRLTSLGAAFADDAAGHPAPKLPSGDYFRAGHNNLTGTLPRGLCSMPATVRSLVLDGNRLSGEVPRCLSDLPGLMVLRLADNAFTSVEAGFGAWNPSLKRLSLARNPIGSASVLAMAHGMDGAASISTLRTLDLSGCPLHSSGSTVINNLLRIFPQLASLSLASCGLFGFLTTPPGSAYPLTALDVAENPYFYGFNTGTQFSSSMSFPAISSLNISSTRAFAGDFYDADFRTLSMNRPSTDCPPVHNLATSELRSLSLVGTHGLSALDTGAGHACRARLATMLQVDETAARAVPDMGLTCPRWLTRASGAAVLTDPWFLRYEQCRCPDGQLWDAAAERCAACPALAEDGLACDPFVLAARHCLVGNVFPARDDGTGRAVRRASALAGAALLRCRRPGLCNTNSDAAAACDGRRTEAASHRNEDEDAAEAPLDFSCASGHDPGSLLCSRCAAGHWDNGGACLPCHGSMRWLVPLAMAAVCAAAVAFLAYRSSRADRGDRSATIVLFWLQLSSLLETSSQVQGSSRGPTVWRWLAAARGAVESWAVAKPWATQCVASGIDYASGSIAVLASPYVVAAAAAVAAAAVPARFRPRVAYVAAWLELALFFPVTVHALAPFSCVSLAGGSFLDAAPYLPCDGGRVRTLRVLGGVTLAVYVVPLVLLCAWLLRRRHGRRMRGEAPSVDVSRVSSTSLGERLLDLDYSDGAAAAAGRKRRFFSRDDGSYAAAPNGLELTYLDVARRILVLPLRDEDELWWWPVAYDLGRKLALALVLGLVPVTSPLLPALVFGVVAAAVMLHAWKRPWRAPGNNTLETLVLVASLAVYLLNIVVGASAAAGSAGASDAQVRSARSLVSILYLAVLVAVGFVVASSQRRRYQRHVRRRRLVELERASSGGLDGDEDGLAVD